MTSYQFAFEKLAVWQLTRSLSTSVYQTTLTFPPEEKYSIVSQIRRSAVSISANIAEGTTRPSFKEQAHFTTIAFGSLMELFNHLIIAGDLGYIGEKELAIYRQKIQLISVKLSNLKASQLNRMKRLSIQASIITLC